MRTSKIFLPDINVWLALSSRRHAFHSHAKEWIGSAAPGQVVFCRITQMGLLRLLPNKQVMGPDVLSQREAWTAYRRLMADERIRFQNEPAGLEEVWRSLTWQLRRASKAWTDAYLLAFARSADLELVTFDKAVRQLDEARVRLLSSSGL
jgi:toxin-antitoxin system PIN domain toxin